MAATRWPYAPYASALVHSNSCSADSHAHKSRRGPQATREGRSVLMLPTLRSIGRRRKHTSLCWEGNV